MTKFVRTTSADTRDRIVFLISSHRSNYLDEGDEEKAEALRLLLEWVSAVQPSRKLLELEEEANRAA